FSGINSHEQRRNVQDGNSYKITIAQFDFVHKFNLKQVRESRITRQDTKCTIPGYFFAIATAAFFVEDWFVGPTFLDLIDKSVATLFSAGFPAALVVSMASTSFFFADVLTGDFCELPAPFIGEGFVELFSRALSLLSLDFFAVANC